MSTGAILGILAISALIITIVLAAFRKKLGIKSMKPHKVSAAILALLAVSHAVYILVNWYL